MSDRLWLLVPAAGQGRRMEADKPKQYLSLVGQPILQHTLQRLHSAFPDAHLVLSLDGNDQWFEPDWVPFCHWQRVAGGQERMESVLNALLAIPAHDNDIVMVHDAARPCIMPADLHRLYRAAKEHASGALLAMPVADTMKRANAEQHSVSTESRVGLWHALTPQGFPYALLRRALEQAAQSHYLVTDEASAVEALGEAPKLISGRRDNLKVTHPDDLALAAAIIASQATQPSARSA